MNDEKARLGFVTKFHSHQTPLPRRLFTPDNLRTMFGQCSDILRTIFGTAFLYGKCHAHAVAQTEVERSVHTRDCKCRAMF